MSAGEIGAMIPIVAMIIPIVAISTRHKRKMAELEVRKLEAEGTRPASATDPQAMMWRAVSITIPRGSDWKPAAAEFMRAKVGADFGYTP